jgi:hypothetical protein
MPERFSGIQFDAAVEACRLNGPSSNSAARRSKEKLWFSPTSKVADKATSDDA